MPDIKLYTIRALGVCLVAVDQEASYESFPKMGGSWGPWNTWRLEGWYGVPIEDIEGLHIERLPSHCGPTMKNFPKASFGLRKLGRPLRYSIFSLMALIRDSVY